MSRAYFPVLLTVSAAFMAAGEPVYGVVALGCIVIWLLAACPDLLAPVCPFFMAFLMSSQCYGQLTDFLPCAALVPPLLVALLWHFAVWPVTCGSAAAAWAWRWCPSPLCWGAAT